VTARTAWLCAAVIGMAALLGAADTPSNAFSVGVLRRDGVLIPFASFDGRQWRNSWPAPDGNIVVPATLEGVPKRWWGPLAKPLDTWQAWVDAKARDVRVTQPDWVQVHCARHLALRTDYHTAEIVPGDAEQPYPKDGLAISPPQRVETPSLLPAAATELEPLLPVLPKAFNDAETQTANRGRHPMSRRAREFADPAIEAAYAIGSSPRYYYIEAMRSYRLLGQAPDDCVATAFGTGWFVREGDTVRSLLTAVDVLPCNRFGASYMLPLGVVRVGERLFWLAQFSGGDHERYVVLEITPKKVDVMVSTWGGGCAR
jgi:hypothetical protein